ncbi:MAG: hypothetical protein IKZ87_05155, partial [Actinomycetaceae bacterium]|nr:hypothetical protein [Actinomycetaceae bacterium]
MESQPQGTQSRFKQYLRRFSSATPQTPDAELISYPPASEASVSDIPLTHGLRHLIQSVPKWKAPSRHSVTFYFTVALMLAFGIAGLIFMLP